MTTFPKLKHISVLSLSAVLSLFLASCNEEKKADAGLVVKELPKTQTILKFEGGQITAGDLTDSVKSELAKLDSQAIETYKQAAERELVNKLLEKEAKKQKTTVEELMSGVGMNSGVADTEVNEFIKANNLEKGVKDPRTGKLQKVSSEEIKRYLESQKRRKSQESFLQGLLASAKVQTVLEEPRTNIKFESYMPFIGGKDAKVVIYEFSDFQCPFCARGHESVKQIHQNYGDKVKIVFRHFPLDFHLEAKPAAIASMCAQDQGKFWQLHDKFFENQQELGTESYKKWAKEVGVDSAKFETCLADADGSKAKLLATDQKAAEAVGINSTPTFFVNGKRLAGALPFDQFKSLIDQELSK